jgi:heterodisulfide reductase subunit A-like polyferredoxin
VSQDVLIIGSNLAATQAALDLANSGIKVHLVEKSPFLESEALDSSRSLAMKTRQLETICHPNIHVLTNTVIQGINFEGENIRAELNHLPRYVNINQCIACGD